MKWKKTGMNENEWKQEEGSRNWANKWLSIVSQYDGTPVGDVGYHLLHSEPNLNQVDLLD